MFLVHPLSASSLAHCRVYSGLLCAAWLVRWCLNTSMSAHTQRPQFHCTCAIFCCSCFHWRWLCRPCAGPPLPPICWSTLRHATPACLRCLVRGSRGNKGSLGDATARPLHDYWLSGNMARPVSPACPVAARDRRCRPWCLRQRWPSSAWGASATCLATTPRATLSGQLSCRSAANETLVQQQMQHLVLLLSSGSVLHSTLCLVVWATEVHRFLLHQRMLLKQKVMVIAARERGQQQAVTTAASHTRCHCTRQL
jgi:hypothetical protein